MTASNPSGLAHSVVDAWDRFGDDPVFVAPRAVSGRRLSQMARHWADDLATSGVGAGEPVALLGLPGALTFAAFIALRLAGAAVVLVEPGAAPEVTRARLQSAGVRLLWASAPVALAAGPLRSISAGRGLHLPRLQDQGMVAALGPAVPGLSRRLRGLQLPPRPHRDAGGATDASDAVIVPTSGTTTAPRSVVHTESSIAASAAAVGALADFQAGDEVLAGTFFAVLPATLAGARVALPSRNVRRRSAQAATADAVYLTPPELRALLDVGAHFRGARIFSGSAPVTHALLQRLRASGAEQAWGVYALTEMLPVAAVEADEKSAWVGSRPGDLLGHLLPGVEARITADRVIEVRGPMMASRYLGSAPMDWVHTGDLGSLTDSLQLVMHGRAKDMILRRAENIYPGLYEPAWHIAGVRTAVLIGVPDSDSDELVVAVIEPEPGVSAQALAADLRAVAAQMGDHRPDHIVAAPIPLSGRSMKPDRAAVAAVVVALLAGAELPGAEVLQ
ncbi:MAG: acyl--CoA ligase [Actinomycetales bacterium]|nr:acyl--CoA ligase [Actinomycetales bacterium]